VGALDRSGVIHPDILSDGFNVLGGEDDVD